MSAPVRVAHCYLDDETTAVAGIDVSTWTLIDPVTERN